MIRSGIFNIRMILHDRYQIESFSSRRDKIDRRSRARRDGCPRLFFFITIILFSVRFVYRVVTWQWWSDKAFKSKRRENLRAQRPANNRRASAPTAPVVPYTNRGRSTGRTAFGKKSKTPKIKLDEEETKRING